MDAPKSIMEFPYAVFDLDGTLVNSMGCCKRVFADLMARRGIRKAEAREFCARTAGSPLLFQFRELLKHNGLPHSEEEIEELRAQFNESFIAYDVKFFAGARLLIRALAEKGVTVMISSGSSDATVEKRLSSGKLSQFVAVACGGTAIEKGTEHIEHFAKCLHIRASDLARYGFFCGDGETDMKIAVAAGFYPIGVSTTISAELLYRAGAARVVPRIGDLGKDL